MSLQTDAMEEIAELQHQHQASSYFQIKRAGKA